MSHRDLELNLRRQRDGAYTASLHAHLPNHDALLAADAAIDLDPTALLALSGDPHAYGQSLCEMLFLPPLRAAWAQAMGYHQHRTDLIHVRLHLDPTADELHSLQWETLYAPDSDGPLALHERILFSRYLGSADLRDLQSASRPDLRALAVVANPEDLDTYHLAPVDVDGEITRARAALDDIPTTVLAHEVTGTPASLSGIAEQLRAGPHIVYLVCHGTYRDGVPYLWLEREDGRAARVTGADFAQTIQHLAQRPLLIVLTACQGAGQSHDTGALAAVGPRLARAGVAAVVAMQGSITMRTVRSLMPTFFRELRRDGRIDRSLAAARATIRDRPDWWAPILFLRVRDGRLWRDEERRALDRHARLHALLHDHSSFVRNRLASFVGREQELAEIRARIAALLPIGGYVTITGQAGQGKSSIIARLAQEYSLDQVTHHFIPINPGPDHQVGLLRNVMARLILKYDLPDLYVAGENRPSLRDFFPHLLTDLSARGGREVIFIDGLDQLEEDMNGVRDLSFLPSSPPAGVVFVLGTRPNDTLAPLELLKPRDEYPLPNLSRPDFDLVLARHGVSLDAELGSRFYTAMQANALYLDLVAQELAAAGAARPENIIARLTDNPANIFSLTIDRLKRRKHLWHQAIKPALGLLLAAREPLSRRAIRQLVGVDSDLLRDGIQSLGGLIATDGGGRHALFHRKFQQYLQQDEHAPNMGHVFDADEAARWHLSLADWCESGHEGLAAIWQDAGSDALEQERRVYARQHYIAHIFHARAWERLWHALDDGAYGRAKMHYDSSMHGYAQDLELGRIAAASIAGTVEDGITALPRLWQYSLLRCSLASHADSYPDQVFETLALIGRAQEAIGLAELLTEAAKKVRVLRMLGAFLGRQPAHAHEGYQLLLRAADIVRTIHEVEERDTARRAIAESLAESGQFADAERLAIAIDDADRRESAFCILISQLAGAGRTAEAERVATRITGGGQRTEAMRPIIMALAMAGRLADAERVIGTIESYQHQMNAWRDLVATLAEMGQFVAAERHACIITDDLLHADALRAIAIALAEAEQFAEAERITSTIGDERWRLEATQTIIMSLARSGQHAQAERLADTITDEILQAEALRTVAIALASAGQFIEAERIAQTLADDMTIIEQQGLRIKEIRATAEALAKHAAEALHPEDREAAEAEVELLRAEALQIEAWRERSLKAKVPQGEALQAVTLALAKAGHTNEALRVARIMIGDWQPQSSLRAADPDVVGMAPQPRPEFPETEDSEVAALQAEALDADDLESIALQTESLQAEALQLAALALAETGKFAQAAQIAREIAIDHVRAQTLCGIAQAAHTADETAMADLLLRDALTIADDIEPHERVRTLCTAAPILAMTAGDASAAQLLDQALDLSLTIDDDGEVGPALHAVARVLPHLRDDATLDQMVDKIAAGMRAGSGSASAAWGFSIAIESLARAERWTAVARALQAMSDVYQRIEVLGHMAYALARIGAVSGAARLLDWLAEAIRALDDVYDRARALRAVTEALADAPYCLDAERVADAIGDAYERVQALYAIMCAYTKAGELAAAIRLLEAATTIACALTSIKQRARALCLLADLVAGTPDQPTGQLLTALNDTVRRIDDASERAPALYAIVRLLARERRWREAKRIARAIQGQQLRVRALRDLAQAFVVTGARREDATRLLTDMLHEVNALSPRMQQNIETLSDLIPLLSTVQEQTALNLLAQMLEYIHTITDAEARAHASIAAAHVLAAVGRRTAGVRLLQKTSELIRAAAPAQDLPQIAGTIAQALVALGEHALAYRTLDAAVVVMHVAPPDWWTAPTLQAIATAVLHIQHGDVKSLLGRLVELVDTLPQPDEQATAALALVDALARQHMHEEALRMIQRYWLAAARREDIIQLLPIACGLIAHSPELGMRFLSAFTWVDDFLQRPLVAAERA
jgi:hypothetical protein